MKTATKPKEKLSTAKKKAWTAFSEYVRTRDCLRTTGCSSFGLCVTCGKRYHYKLLQAGHFIAGRHNAVLFSEKGVHAQCYNCNVNLRGNTLEYRRKIVELYGEGFDEYLEYESNRTVKLNVQDCKLIEKYYKQMTKELTGGIVDDKYMQSQSANIEESLKRWREI